MFALPLVLFSQGVGQQTLALTKFFVRFDDQRAEFFVQKFVEETRGEQRKFAFAIVFQKSSIFENVVRFLDRQRVFADQLQTGEKFQKLFVVEKMIFRLEFVQNRSFLFRVERFLRPNGEIFPFQIFSSSPFVLLSTRVFDHSLVKIAFGGKFFDDRGHFVAKQFVEDSTRSPDALVPFDDQLAEIEEKLVDERTESSTGRKIYS